MEVSMFPLKHGPRPTSYWQGPRLCHESWQWDRSRDLTLILSQSSFTHIHSVLLQSALHVTSPCPNKSRRKTSGNLRVRRETGDRCRRRQIEEGNHKVQHCHVFLMTADLTWLSRKLSAAQQVFKAAQGNAQQESKQTSVWSRLLLLYLPVTAPFAARGRRGQYQLIPVALL